MENGRPLVYLSFLTFGITTLLPWNLFVTAEDYFRYKLRNASDVSIDPSSANFTLTPLQRTFEGWLTTSYSMTLILGTGANILLTTKISNKLLVNTAHVLVFISLVPTVALTSINTDNVQQLYFCVSIILCIVSSIGSSLLNGSALSMATLFPAQNVQAFLLGQAIAGILTSVGSIISQAATPDPALNGFVYFMTATLWTLFSHTVYVLLYRSDHFQQVVAHHERLVGFEADVNEPLLNESLDTNNSSIEDSTVFYHSHTCLKSLITVLSETKYDCSAIILTYVITLSCFPAITSLVVSNSSNPIWKDYFSPVACFLLFNCADATGRFLCTYFRWPYRSSHLLLCALLRTILIPLILLCNVEPRYHTRSLFFDDWTFMLLLLIFGISNGYTVCLANIRGVENAEESVKEMAGSVFAMAAVSGVAIGSIVGFLFVNIV